jgi:hypothetical protein
MTFIMRKESWSEPGDRNIKIQKEIANLEFLIKFLLFLRNLRP